MTDGGGKVIITVDSSAVVDKRELLESLSWQVNCDKQLTGINDVMPTVASTASGLESL